MKQTGLCPFNFWCTRIEFLSVNRFSVYQNRFFVLKCQKHFITLLEVASQAICYRHASTVRGKNESKLLRIHLCHSNINMCNFNKFVPGTAQVFISSQRIGCTIPSKRPSSHIASESCGSHRQFQRKKHDVCEIFLDRIQFSCITCTLSCTSSLAQVYTSFTWKL